MRMKSISVAVITGGLSLALLTGCSLPGTNDVSASTDDVAATTSSSTAGLSGTTELGTGAALSSVTVSYDSSDYYFDWRSNSYTTLNMSSGTQTITKSGIYEITGTLSDGSLEVDIDKSVDEGTVYLVLNNTNISSATSAPIYIKDAKKVVLILEDGTTNVVTQGEGVIVNDDNEPSAAIHSNADLSITGGGTLTVVSEFNDGITSKDTLKMTDGTLSITVKGDGLVGKDILAIETGSITITAGKDGLRSTNDTDAGMGNILIQGGTFNIDTENDAIQAYGVLQIDGGVFELASGGGYSGITSVNSTAGPGGMGEKAQTTASTTATESQKCLKATGGIVIDGGEFTTSSYEDSVHTDGDVIITSGTFTIQAGDDGIHADGSITISSGIITIQNSYESVEGTNITVSGGEVSFTSSDDGFNVNDASGTLTISGGSITMDAGGDGTDSNGSIVMTGGTVYVSGPTDNGNGAIDYGTSFSISGGTIVATGSSGMAQSPDTNSSQPSILMYYSSTQAAGTAVTLKDESGNILASYTPSKAYSSAAISAPDLKTGQTYTLYSGETEVVTVTLADTVTYLNESGVTTNQGMMSGGMNNPGGQFGGEQFGGGHPAGGKPEFNS